MEDSTVPSDANGRDIGGRFSKGNKFARGNPVARRTQRLRAANAKAITPKESMALTRKMYELGMAGDVPAAREVYQRTVGPPIAADLLERLERLEELIQERRK
jgi:hypothetical protein